MLMVAIIFNSCYKTGTTRQKITGNEETLPSELKGLKVYSVSTGDLGDVKVAILDNKVNSTTYQVGKTQETTIVLNKQNKKLIEVSKLLFENDSLVIFQK